MGGLSLTCVQTALASGGARTLQRVKPCTDLETTRFISFQLLGIPSTEELGAVIYGKREGRRETERRKNKGQHENPALTTLPKDTG